jgi:hypothetical protein
MRPIKASFFFLYCLAALTAVGTTVSHLWRTAKVARSEAAKIAPAQPS